MKLYYDPMSTTSRAVMLFVQDEGVDLDAQVVSLMGGENWAAAYAALNPNHTVPFLVDGPLEVGESSAILKYLAEKTGSRAYPRDLAGRARVNAAMDWFNTRFHLDFCYLHVYTQVLPAERVPPGDLAGVIAFGAREGARWLDVLDRHMLAGKRFVCGDTVGLADFFGAAFVTVGELVGFDYTPWPNVRAWLERMKSRPSWAPANAGFEGWVAARRFETRAAARVEA